MFRLAAATLVLLAAPALAAPEWRQARDYEVRLTGDDIEPRTMRFRAGEPLRLRLVNVSGQSHSFEAGDFFAAAQLRPREARVLRGGKVIVPAGDERTLLLVPRAGRYSAHSGNLLRRILGMNSAIIVE
ncbi:MAG TPA: hypothetical protein VF628_09055 [Allosphingosinicella sp.]|jgi:hypothetical protein